MDEDRVFYAVRTAGILCHEGCVSLGSGGIGLFRGLLEHCGFRVSLWLNLLNALGARTEGALAQPSSLKAFSSFSMTYAAFTSFLAAATIATFSPLLLLTCT
jgi:hypothetical protein